MSRYIFPLILVVLAAAVYVFFTDASIGNIRTALARENELSAYIEDAKSAQAKLDQIKGRYENFPPGADQSLHAILPDTIDPVRFVVDVNAVVERRGLIIKSPQVATILPEKGSSDTYVKHTLSFTVSAPYELFRTLLGDLESSLALRNMENISFSSQDSKQETNLNANPLNAVHDYRVEISSYSLGS